MIKYIFSFSFQSLLLWTNIILFSLFFKKIRIKEKISIISLCFGFLFVQSIFLFRYEQDTYYLNSEFFLLFSLAILLKYIKINFYYFLFTIPLLILLTFSSLDHIKDIKNNNKTNICNWVNFDKDGPDGSKSYYNFWTNLFPYKVISHSCNKDNL